MVRAAPAATMGRLRVPMPRCPLFLITDLPLHVVQRGNDRRPCFFEEGDFRIYLKLLAKGCTRYGVHVHAYALMANHVQRLRLTAGLANQRVVCLRGIL